MLDDDLVQVEHLRLEHLLAAEREELPRELGGALAGLRESPRRPRASGRPASRSREQQLRVAEDHREHVVEVVRHAAGQPADGLHLLRLAELLLGLAQRLLGALARSLRLAFASVRSTDTEMVLFPSSVATPTRTGTRLPSLRTSSFSHGRATPRSRISRRWLRRSSHSGGVSCTPVDEPRVQVLARVAHHGEECVVGLQILPDRSATIIADDAGLREPAKACLALTQRLLGLGGAPARSSDRGLALDGGDQATELAPC